MKNKQTIEMLVSHFDKCRGFPLIEKVLRGNSSFQKEVSNFYGLSSTSSIAPAQYYAFDKFDSSKEGKVPVDLVTTLNPFNEYDFCSDILEYRKVRENFSKFSRSFHKKIGISFPLMMGGFVGLMYSQYEPISTLISGISFLAGTSMSLYFPTHGNVPKPNTPLDEFNSLYSASYRADEFLEEINLKKP